MNYREPLGSEMTSFTADRMQENMGTIWQKCLQWATAGYRANEMKHSSCQSLWTLSHFGMCLYDKSPHNQIAHLNLNHLWLPPLCFLFPIIYFIFHPLFPSYWELGK